jgi:DNA replication protein DnaC
MIKKAFNNFVQEAELFFVKKFITSPTIENEYSDCLDIIFDITKTKDSTKGIIAFNQKYGQGKSFFFDVVNHRHRRLKGKNIYKRITAKDLVDIYLSQKDHDLGIVELKKTIKVERLFIDDIGDEGEKKTFKQYGNELNVLRYVLLKRYEMWEKNGWITYGTTNLTLEQIASNYDGRVADRLMQMTYWKEFKFLKDGSFRQVGETRKLTQSEIAENWKKFEVPEQPVKIDLEQYFNELIHEGDGYFIEKDISFWTFVKNYLIEKGILSDKDFEVIDDEAIENARTYVRHEVRETKKQTYRHAGNEIRSLHIGEALSKITQHDVLTVAQNKIAKQKFMELRESKYKFL